MVPARRKLHQNGAMSSTSFTEMTGFKAVRVAVAEMDERWGYRADTPGGCGAGVRVGRGFGGADGGCSTGQGRVMEA